MTKIIALLVSIFVIQANAACTDDQCLAPSGNCLQKKPYIKDSAGRCVKPSKEKSPSP